MSRGESSFIPPEREAEYLANAELAMNSLYDRFAPELNDAFHPVVEGLAAMIVRRATNEALELQHLATGLGVFADQVEAYVHEHDYHLGDFSTGIGDEVERAVQHRNYPGAQDGKPRKPDYNDTEFVLLWNPPTPGRVGELLTLGEWAFLNQDDRLAAMNAVRKYKAFPTRRAAEAIASVPTEELLYYGLSQDEIAAIRKQREES